jgi:glycopeptide antibiotics resistance protein
MLKSSHYSRKIYFAILISYLGALLLFTLYPRPLLENPDPTFLENFLKTHSSFFYKILYADSNLVYWGNFFLLTPLPLLAILVNPKLKLIKLTTIGIFVSLFIEVTQIGIPGRVPDLVDFLANSAGLIFAGVITGFFKSKNPFIGDISQ